MPGVTLTGILDIVPEHARTLAAELNTHVFASMAELLEIVDVLCIAVPTMDHYLLAETAVKQGKHLFLESPATTSVLECESLVKLAEEADVEVGVSSPRRFHPVRKLWPTLSFPSLIVHQIYGAVVEHDRFHWPRRLTEVVDFCCVLAGSSSVRRIHGQAVRDPSALLETVALGLRFHKGTYAQITMRRQASQAGETLTLAGPNLRLEADLNVPRATLFTDAREPRSNDQPVPTFDTISFELHDPLEAELRAFLKAVQQGSACPVSILDALDTMRLIERVLATLR
jgi:predicted dehydrogenase